MRLAHAVALALVMALAAVACAPTDVTPPPDPTPAVAEAAAPGSPSPGSRSPGGEACQDTCGGSHDAAGDAAHACSGEGSSPSAVDAAALQRVPAEQVCMRSNRFQKNRPQISTDVDGRTYFGCCAGCAKGLAQDAAARTAKDPVSGNPVDKASAVIGARPDGSVVYFESEETFARAGGA